MKKVSFFSLIIKLFLLVFIGTACSSKIASTTKARHKSTMRTYHVLGKTYYPKWILIFNPIVPFLFGNLVVENLEGEVKMIIGGGYLNLILTLFFSASTIALWRAEHD